MHYAVMHSTHGSNPVYQSPRLCAVLRCPPQVRATPKKWSDDPLASANLGGRKVPPFPGPLRCMCCLPLCVLCCVGSLCGGGPPVHCLPRALCRSVLCSMLYDVVVPYPLPPKSTLTTLTL